MTRPSADTVYSAEQQDWNRNAAFYRSDERSALMRILAAQRRLFYAIRPGDRVLDIGCGAGGTVAELRNESIDAVGIDFSADMIRAAIDEHGLAGFVTCTDATDLPFDSNSFDVVLADGVLHHLAVQERLAPALREMRRVLKPGGRLCVFDRNGSLVSAALLRLCIGVKDLIRFVTRGDRYASSATRHEIPFGGRNDLRIIEETGFRLARRRGVASAPFFLSVVMLNAMQYFLSDRIRSRIEPVAGRILSRTERHCTWQWLCVEQLAVFDCAPQPAAAASKRCAPRVSHLASVPA